MPNKNLPPEIVSSDPGEVGREHHTILDRIVVNTSNLVSWAFPLLMICIVAQVFLRGAGNNQAWLDDLQWWIYGFAMMTGLAYAITTGSHVRVDILHQHYSEEKKAKIEVMAIGWMLLPFLFLMMDILIHYAVASFEAGEGSDSPNGLHRLYLLKITLPFLFLLASIAAWAIFLRNLRKFGDGSFSSQMIWAFPAIVFGLWRLMHYLVYWIVRLSNPDLNPRRVTREPVFDYLLPAALLLVIAIILVSFLMSRRNQSEDAA